jgi:hypothetical protein
MRQCETALHHLLGIPINVGQREGVGVPKMAWVATQAPKNYQSCFGTSGLIKGGTQPPEVV